MSKQLPIFNWAEKTSDLKQMFTIAYEIPREGNDKMYFSLQAGKLMFGAYKLKARFVMDAKTDKLIRVVFNPDNDEIDGNTARVLFGYMLAKFELMYGSPRIITSTDEENSLNFISPHYLWETETQDIHLEGTWSSSIARTSFIIDNKSLANEL